MDTAVVVAGISGVVALASARFSYRAQLAVTERVAQRDRESREEERRSEAKQVLDRYRGPFMDAAWQLGNRIDNIRHRNFLAYRSASSGREDDAKLTTLFRFANYFGWREFVRREVQLLRFDNEDDTRLVAGFLNDVAALFSSDGLDEGRAMLWVDEQRGIGEAHGDRSLGSPYEGGERASRVPSRLRGNVRSLAGAIRHGRADAISRGKRPSTPTPVGLAWAREGAGRDQHVR